MAVIVARQDLPMRCCRCRARIDKGDEYEIRSVSGGFDYFHADCQNTAQLHHIRAGNPNPERRVIQ